MRGEIVVKAGDCPGQNVKEYEKYSGGPAGDSNNPGSNMVYAFGKRGVECHTSSGQFTCPARMVSKGLPAVAENIRIFEQLVFDGWRYIMAYGRAGTSGGNSEVFNLLESFLMLFQS